MTNVLAGLHVKTRASTVRVCAAALLLIGLSGLSACNDRAVSIANDAPVSAVQLQTYQDQLRQTLADPAQRSQLIAKVLGSTVKDERHAFLKFHVFGFAGDGNLIPFYSFNNYVVQKWAPGEDDSYQVTHYETAYYTKFDTNEPIETWENPLTGEVLDLPPFVLGPVPRIYGPGHGETPDSFAPDPLNITMIGDRIYVPTLTRLKVPNFIDPKEWGPYSSGPITYWDSMLVYSADARDVFDDSKTHVAADIHMQNLISWSPFLKMGQSPGRTMVRAYGQHISGYDALPADIRKNFEKYTPEIFDTEGWTVPRIDGFEFLEELKAKRAAGTLDIDQDDYVPPRIKSFDEVQID